MQGRSDIRDNYFRLRVAFEDKKRTGGRFFEASLRFRFAVERIPLNASIFPNIFQERCRKTRLIVFFRTVHSISAVALGSVSYILRRHNRFENR
jgi:hypothetical protein